MSDVTPITPTHNCPSCKYLVAYDVRFEITSHAETCMQPEIRMRRLEARVALIHENMTLLAALTVPKDQHGSSKEPTEHADDAKPYLSPGDGLSEASLRALWNGPYPDYRSEPHANAEPAEPSGEAPAGAEPTGGGPERTG